MEFSPEKDDLLFHDIQWPKLIKAPSFRLEQLCAHRSHIHVFFGWLRWVADEKVDEISILEADIADLVIVKKWSSLENDSDLLILSNLLVADMALEVGDLAVYKGVEIDLKSFWGICLLDVEGYFGYLNVGL